MTKYNVHIYREMRLTFEGIEADTPDAAAAIAHDKPTGDADDIDDCEGENLAALVDVAGDQDYEQSRLIDFEPERQRKTASALLSSLKAVLPYAESEGESLYECWKRDGDLQIKDASDRCAKVIANAHAAIAEATTADVSPGSMGTDIHATLADRHQIAVIWSVEDVQQERPGLNDDAAWQVLQSVEHNHDCNYGITWETLRITADDLFDSASRTDGAQGGSHEPR